VELLAPSEEQALLARVKDASTRSLVPANAIASLGRLAEPLKLRRTFERGVNLDREARLEPDERILGHPPSLRQSAAGSKRKTWAHSTA
jgi:hypothetical protein